MSASNNPSPTAPTTFDFITENLAASYANFANVNSTREEVVLNFGMNRCWDRARTSQEVELNHRVVMSPHGAKRMAKMLADLVAEHEKRYGPINV